jgi:hypothetical protein
MRARNLTADRTLRVLPLSAVFQHGSQERFTVDRDRVIADDDRIGVFARRFT